MATLSLIAVNLAAFGYARSSAGPPDPVQAALFGHADAVGFALNVLFLWWFGPNVEDQLGRARFVALYAACAAAARAAAMSGVESTATMGAAAGVGGVLGAYLALFPRSRMLLFFPIPPTLHELPVLFFLFPWLLLQGLSQTAGADAGAPAAVAIVFLAVAAMLALGALLGLVLRRRERARVEWWGP